MTDHEPFQREPQNPQDPQVVVFSPELLKLADRRRQALEDCRQAAEDGDANAVVQMGMNCLYGIGGAAKDPEKAFRWFSQTAPDDPAGLYWLGVCYDNGFGVERDEDRACRLYQESAAGDYAPALCNLGVCYESGQGVEKNLEKAVELYRRAAEQGSDLARCRLGRLYERGLGVERDLRRAEELYEAGTRAGVSGAKEAMDRVRAALAAPPEPQPEDKPVDKKSPLRRLLDRLKGPKSEE